MTMEIFKIVNWEWKMKEIATTVTKAQFLFTAILTLNHEEEEDFLPELRLGLGVETV